LYNSGKVNVLSSAVKSTVLRGTGDLNGRTCGLDEGIQSPVTAVRPHPVALQEGVRILLADKDENEEADKRQCEPQNLTQQKLKSSLAAIAVASSTQVHVLSVHFRFEYGADNLL